MLQKSPDPRSFENSFDETRHFSDKSSRKMDDPDAGYGLDTGYWVKPVPWKGKILSHSEPPLPVQQLNFPVRRECGFWVHHFQ